MNQLSTVSNQSYLEVEKIGIPCPPVRLREAESGTEWSLLEWELDTNCEEKFVYVSSYTLEYMGSGGVRDQLEVNGDTLLFNVSDLTPNTAYQVSCLHRMNCTLVWLYCCCRYVCLHRMNCTLVWLYCCCRYVCLHRMNCTLVWLYCCCRYVCLQRMSTEHLSTQSTSV